MKVDNFEVDRVIYKLPVFRNKHAGQLMYPPKAWHLGQVMVSSIHPSLSGWRVTVSRATQNNPRWVGVTDLRRRFVQKYWPLQGDNTWNQKETCKSGYLFGKEYFLFSRPQGGGRKWSGCTYSAIDLRITNLNKIYFWVITHGARGEMKLASISKHFTYSETSPSHVRAGFRWKTQNKQNTFLAQNSWKL